MCFNNLTRSAFRSHRAIFPRTTVSLLQVRYVEKDPPGAKDPAKAEQIDKIKMPGFVHPDTINEEGYFTQKAKHQIEELRKKIDKPKVENTEKKE